MNQLIRLALRNGWRRGLLGGQRTWLIAGSFALGVRIIQKVLGAEPEVVYSEHLSPGETLVIARERSSD